MKESEINYSVYVQDILNAINRIAEYTVVGEKQFLESTQIQDAVIRQISIVGEAASKLPRSITGRYSDVPWDEVVAMRNILVHEYSDVNIPRVWDTVTDDIPVLKETAIQMMNDLNINSSA